MQIIKSKDANVGAACLGLGKELEAEVSNFYKRLAEKTDAEGGEDDA